MLLNWPLCLHCRFPPHPFWWDQTRKWGESLWWSRIQTRLVYTKKRLYWPTECNACGALAYTTLHYTTLRRSLDRSVQSVAALHRAQRTYGCLGCSRYTSSLSMVTTQFSFLDLSAWNTSRWLRRVSSGPVTMRDGSLFCRKNNYYTKYVLKA